MPSLSGRLGRLVALRCPRCGRGRLFVAPFRMADACGECNLDFRREGGFYLGSIYLNYAATILAAGAVAAAAWGLAGWSLRGTIAAALAVAVLLPLLLFHHARAALLAIDAAVNRWQLPTGTGEPDPPRALTADDAQAGCALGVALVAIFLFGLAMAAVTIAVARLAPTLE